MQSAEWLKIKDIFYQTLDLSAKERERFLAFQDDFVRSEVAALIASHEHAQDFIVEPAIAEFGLDGRHLIGKNIGGYEILDVVGAGGMGTVFLAQKEGFEKKVALKIIKRGMDTDAVLRRFLQERQILSRLQHPGIAALLDGGTTDDGLPFFVMEYIEGVPLTRFCDEHLFDIKERLELFRQICAAVAYSHQNLIIHRDLKPSNILVTNEGTPKLLDFGIAKLLNLDGLDSTATATQGRHFTPEYASPEHLNGNPITTASDVYSLGVVLYELLSGVRPFQSKSGSYQEIANAVLTEYPVRPSYAWRDTETGRRGSTGKNRPVTASPRHRVSPSQLKGDLDNIILKAIRKEPDRRYQSVPEFSEDIRRYLVGLPVTATADSTIYRFKKFVTRHQIGTIFAILILLVSGFAVWQGFVANRERAKAENHVRQVREMAKSLLNETSQNLQNLPDGAEVRQQIIEKSAKILDSLSADVDDVEYLSELGTAYQQLGYSRTWHLRNYEQASSDLQKARQLQERVVELEPNNSKYLGNLVGTLGVQNEFYGIQGNTDKVVENYQTIIKIDLKRVEIEPNNPNIFINTSNIYDNLNEYYNSVGRKEDSVEASRKALELLERAVELQQAKEQTPDVQTQLAAFFMQKGYILNKSGKEDEAILAYQKAAETADQAYFQDNTQKFGFNHSTRSRRMMAEIYGKRGDWQKALELYQHCLNNLLQNKENKHLVQKSLPSSIALYTIFVGTAQDKLGKKKEGRENVEKGLNIYLTNLKKYENLAADILYAPEFLLPVMDFYVANNQKRTAAGLWQQEYINRLETILQKNPNDVGMLTCLTNGFERKGDVLGSYGSAEKTFSETSPTLLKEAEDNYIKALERIKKVLALDRSASNITKKSNEITHKIELVRSKLTK